MGLAALKISGRCAHPFPTNDPAARRTDTACFLPRRQIDGSLKMGAAVARLRGGGGGLAGEWGGSRWSLERPAWEGTLE